jgi:hypothetical protein
MRRLLRGIGWSIGVLVVLVVGLELLLGHAATPTHAGADAEALAHEMVRAVDGDAWARTGAVRWRIGGRAHLWDRQRGLARVEWRGYRALIDVNTKKGRVWRDGAEITDPAAKQPLLDKAYAWWINDSFWLNPVVKAFDDGTSRTRGTVAGKRALEVAYASGGLTPGDRYLWILGDDGRPVAWRLWVHIVPVPGVEFSWGGWTRLSTGAWVATRHEALGRDVVAIHDLAAAATLRELEPNDPFSPIT